MKRHNLVAATLVFFCQVALAQQNRPNIIFIITDNLDNRSVAYMPNLKTLITDQGASFSNYFVNVPLCCPSRASILRGQYAHNHQVETLSAPLGGFKKFRDSGYENSTLATWLHDAGYRTALFGKYLNGYPAPGQQTYIPTGWDEWSGVIDGHYFNYVINENGTVVSYGAQPEDYETDVLSRQVTAFIRRNTTTPFFIYLAPPAPHSPNTPAPRHQNEFAGLQAPRVPSFNEAEVSDKPQWVRDKALLSNAEIAQHDALYRERLQCLLAVDEMIKSIVDTLAATNALKNTYIFFTSDNGFHLVEHRIPSGENTPYDESTHLPLFVRGPGVLKGKKLEPFAQNIDLAPTFAELAGATTPNFVDGRSLAPLLKSASPPVNTWRQGALIEHWLSNEGIPTFQALRTKEYLYVEYDTGERELYDVHNDPYQLQSLHATAAPALIAQLAKQLDALRKCTGAGCLTVGVKEQESAGQPLQFELLQNYPNPFLSGAKSPALGRGNPGTTIRFSLPQSEHVILKVFDINGQEMQALVNGKLSAGEHSIKFDAVGVPSGIYFYRLVTPTASITKSMGILK